MEPSTKQDSALRGPDGKLLPGAKLNPEGVGGFGENPENRSDGRWDKEGSISYQYHKLMRMKPEELETFKPETVAQEIALKRIQEAKKTTGLHEAKEITDRTEGKAPQSIDLTSGGEQLIPTVRIIDERSRDTDTG